MAGFPKFFQQTFEISPRSLFVNEFLILMHFKRLPVVSRVKPLVVSPRLEPNSGLQRRKRTNPGMILDRS